VNFLGGSVGTAGDFNGDGISDLILGACVASPFGKRYAGAAYVIFGRPVGTPFSDIDLASSITDAGIGFQVLLVVDVFTLLNSNCSCSFRFLELLLEIC